MNAIDQPGKFFLGGVIDPVSGKRTGDNVFYESRNLTTHGVIVGMTGSGKTGLGIVILEEALISGIPCLIIDPKGDMGNLLLNFPSFFSEDFRPWLNVAEAGRSGIGLDQLANQTSANWKSGLDGWGIGADRMRTLGTSADFVIYTPGSSSGIPINIVGSLASPDLDWSTPIQAEIARDEIEGLVSSLLVLAEIDANPISSPEHILLANLIEKAWSDGRDLDLTLLIAQVRHPPMRKLGVFDLESFYPEKERDKLAMRLNGLIASPAFVAWMEGPPLDIEKLLYAPNGQPQASIVYLAHLSDAERQFVVTLLLSKLVTWMRRQAGTPDLRALVYMDEVFGFAPPTAEPPSKKQILTIIKQARAFGVGMVLSTQNPVDLDYKAMSNAGTWMIGRLQTERDKTRILEGIQSVSGQVDVKLFDKLISSLGKRQFILQSAQAKEPLVFTSRWTISYLAGPLDRNQVIKLMADHPARKLSPSVTAFPGKLQIGVPDRSEDVSQVAPKVDASVSVYYLDPAAPWASRVRAVPGGTRWRAGLVARIHLAYKDRGAGVDHVEEWEAVFFPLSDRFDPKTAINVDYDDRDLIRQPPNQALYMLPEASLEKAAYFKEVRSSLRDYLSRSRSIRIFRNSALHLFSRVGESRTDFEARCQEAAENVADAEVAKLRDRYDVSFHRIRDQLSSADRRARELDADVHQRHQQEVILGAGDLLSGLLSGRRRSISLNRAASRRSQTMRSKERLHTAEEKKAEKATELEQLEDELAQDITEITEKWNSVAMKIEEIEISLDKTDVDVDDVGVLWIPIG
jgi:Helicase HerA, central domain